MNLLQISNIVNFIIGDRLPDIPSLTPAKFCDLLHIAQLKHYKRKLGLPEEYQPGMPLPRQAFDITQKITEDLRRFKVIKDGPSAIPVVGGRFNYPAGYYYPSSLVAFIEYPGEGTRSKVIEIVTDKRWDEMQGNWVDRPNDEYPIANSQATFIRVAPETIIRVGMVYLRQPSKPVYSVTISPNGVNQYNPAGSSWGISGDDWDEVNQVDIMYVLLSDLGITMQRQDVFQIAEKHKQQGI
jgi:hypothetical protein